MELEMPQLYHHFKNEGVNPVLYASEWFSTLFAYNFPLEIGTAPPCCFLLFVVVAACCCFLTI
jgi:hypothetical protein